jgi:hypothetical protein
MLDILKISVPGENEEVLVSTRQSELVKMRILLIFLTLNENTNEV